MDQSIAAVAGDGTGGSGWPAVACVNANDARDGACQPGGLRAASL